MAERPAPATVVDTRLVEGHLQFGFDLMRQLWQEKSGENLVLSPASAALVLSLTANGAHQLNDALTAMGMGIAFEDERANFTGMTEDLNFFITLVRQKTFLEINEEGTEAAAATAVEMTVSGPPPEKPVEVVADHPYFVAIRDDKSGAVFFTAAIVNP